MAGARAPALFFVPFSWIGNSRPGLGCRRLILENPENEVEKNAKPPIRAQSMTRTRAAEVLQTCAQGVAEDGSLLQRALAVRQILPHRGS
jgi:hypothetical protein